MWQKEVFSKSGFGYMKPHQHFERPFTHTFSSPKGQGKCHTVFKQSRKFRDSRSTQIFSTGNLPPTPPPQINRMTDDGSEPPFKINWKFVLVLTCAGALVIWIIMEIWEQGASWQENTDSASVSIIIPTLNEEAILEQRLLYLQNLRPQAHEIILVDGGSRDKTVSLAEKIGVTVIHGEKGRAKQMNAGANAATGQILCFVHADSTPPPNLVSCARDCLKDGRTVMGGFRVKIKDGKKLLKWMTFHQLIKTYSAPLVFRPLSFARGLRAMFGDQNLFCRKSDFQRVGGYDPHLPIMEDLDLLMRLHYAGPEIEDRHAKISGHKHRQSADIGMKGRDNNLGGGVLGNSKLDQSLPSKTAWPQDLGPISMTGKEKESIRQEKQTRENLSLNAPIGLQEVLAEQSSWSKEPSLNSKKSRGSVQEYREDSSASLLVSPEVDQSFKQTPGHIHDCAPDSIVRHNLGWRKGGKCRGRIRMILNPCSETSGRRLALWGNFRGTWIHFRLATWWYFGGSKDELKRLYDRIYTDNYR